MPRDAERPWWDDAQDYRHRAERRRFAHGGRASSADDLGVDLPAVERLASRADARSVRRRGPEARASSRRLASERGHDRLAGSDPYAVETEAERDARRRRRAAAARAAAQERRATRAREEPEAFGWAWESPYASPSEEREREDERVAHQRHARREARATGRPVPARRRRGPHPVVARPERILLWAALLGLFLVLAAASSGDAAALSAGV